MIQSIEDLHRVSGNACQNQYSREAFSSIVVGFNMVPVKGLFICTGASAPASMGRYISRPITSNNGRYWLWYVFWAKKIPTSCNWSILIRSSWYFIFPLLGSGRFLMMLAKRNAESYNYLGLEIRHQARCCVLKAKIWVDVCLNWNLIVLAEDCFVFGAACNSGKALGKWA